MLAIVLAVCSIIAGMLGSVFMIVLFLVGSANADPAHYYQTKWLIGSVLLVQLLALGMSIGLMINERGWLACGAGPLPVAYSIVLIFALVKMEW